MWYFIAFAVVFGLSLTPLVQFLALVLLIPLFFGLRFCAAWLAQSADLGERQRLLESNLKGDNKSEAFIEIEVRKLEKKPLMDFYNSELAEKLFALFFFMAMVIFIGLQQRYSDADSNASDYEYEYRQR